MKSNKTEPYSLCVPQGSFALINRHTPSHITGVHTVGLYTCRLLAIVDPDKKNILLAHCDAGTEIGKGEHSLRDLVNMVTEGNNIAIPRLQLILDKSSENDPAYDKIKEDFKSIISGKGGSEREEDRIKYKSPDGNAFGIDRKRGIVNFDSLVLGEQPRESLVSARTINSMIATEHDRTTRGLVCFYDGSRHPTNLVERFAQAAGIDYAELKEDINSRLRDEKMLRSDGVAISSSSATMAQAKVPVRMRLSEESFLEASSVSELLHGRISDFGESKSLSQRSSQKFSAAKLADKGHGGKDEGHS